MKRTREVFSTTLVVTAIVMIGAGPCFAGRFAKRKACDCSKQAKGSKGSKAGKGGATATPGQAWSSLGSGPDAGSSGTFVPTPPSPMVPEPAPVREPLLPAPRNTIRSPSDARPSETQPSETQPDEDRSPADLAPTDPAANTSSEDVETPANSSENEANPLEGLFDDPAPDTSGEAQTPRAETPQTDSPDASQLEDLFNAPEDDPVPPAPPADDPLEDLFGDPGASLPQGQRTGTNPSPPVELVELREVFAATARTPPRRSAATSQPAVASVLPTRNWKDRSGRFGVSGRLIAINATTARILKDNQRSCSIQIELLSEDDRHYLKQVRSRIARGENLQLSVD